MAKKARSRATPKPQLPLTYLQWLEKLGRKRVVAFAEREWELATEKQLARNVNIDGQRGAYVEQARLFAQMLAEYTPHAVDGAGKKFPLDRVQQFLTLGCDNEDLLCVDPGDKYSVWCFAPSEGGYVERLAKSLDKFMQEATVVDD